MAKKLIPALRAFVMSRAAVRGLWEFTRDERGQLRRVQVRAQRPAGEVLRVPQVVVGADQRVHGVRPAMPAPPARWRPGASVRARAAPRHHVAGRPASSARREPKRSPDEWRDRVRLRVGEECGMATADDRGDLPEAPQPIGPPVPPRPESPSGSAWPICASGRSAPGPGSKPAGPTRPRSTPRSRPSSGTPRAGEACWRPRWRSASSCSWCPTPSSWSPGSAWRRPRRVRIPGTPPVRRASAGCSPVRSPAPAPCRWPTASSPCSSAGSPWP